MASRNREELTTFDQASRVFRLKVLLQNLHFSATGFMVPGIAVKCKAVPKAKYEFDGHTSTDVLKRLESTL